MGRICIDQPGLMARRRKSIGEPSQVDGPIGADLVVNQNVLVNQIKKILDLLAKFSMSGIIKPQDLVNLTHAKI
jgi:hypothetical protein